MSAIATSIALSITESNNALLPQGNRWVRWRMLPNSAWGFPAYNADQIIAQIHDLQPTVLERFIGGTLNPTTVVPSPSKPNMTIADFLNLSMAAGAKNCVVTPRLSCNDYFPPPTGPAGGSPAFFFQEAQQLYNFPCNPPMRTVSLDDWATFNRLLSAAEITSIFSTLFSQGWLAIDVNDVGGNYPAPNGWAWLAHFGINHPQTTDWTQWVPALGELATIKTLPGIKRVSMYIDFPNQMKDFVARLTAADGTCDLMANVFTTNIAPLQATKGFTFVWPIIQGNWDANTKLTLKAGPYGGQTIYQVMKGLMQRYN